MNTGPRAPADSPVTPVENENPPESARRATDDLLKQIKESMGDSWLPMIYSERILKLRTRSYEFPLLTRNSAPEIQHTLLGIELKVGRKRMLCPDLATARYLAVFARAGCRVIAVPYDITMISHLADVLESSWHRMLLLADSLTSKGTAAFATRVRTTLIGTVRQAIAAAGAGTRIPEFKQSTKQGRQ